MYISNTSKDKCVLSSILVGMAKDRSIDTIGVTSGCFDILHPLHIQYLEKCAAMCDMLIVGVDSDEQIYKLKNKLAVYSEHDRAYMVSALDVTDVTFVMEDLESLRDVLSELTKATNGPTIQLYKASNSYYGQKVLEVPGVELVMIPDVYPVSSTTDIVRFIQQDYKKL